MKTLSAKSRFWQMVPSVAIIMLTLLGLAWLFRTDTTDNPELGLIQKRYWWGFARELRADTNRDGRCDFRAVFEKGLADIGPHDTPLEFWEDEDHNGVFEIHAIYSDGALSLVELDRDQDGRYEETLAGAAAKSFFEKKSRLRNQADEWQGLD